MNLNLIRIGKLAIIILIFVSLLGCWDRREVNDVAIILTTGIDLKGDKEVELSVEMVMPEEMAGKIKEGGGGTGTRTTFVESATGMTLADARSKLQEKVARYLFWGHAEATVIGEELAKVGIREHVDFIVRMPEARLRNKVFVSKGKAKDLISSLPHLEDSAAETLQELSQFQIGMDVTMSELLQMLASETGGAALPMIESTPPTKEPGKLPDKTQLKLSGTAVFKEGKMVGALDSEVTRGLLWLRNEIRFATITLGVPEGEGKVSMEMINSQTERIPQIKNDTWKIMVKIKAEDDVIQNASNLDLRNPEFIKMLENQLKKEIEERVNLAVEKVQKEMKVDIFKFDTTFQRKYKKKWQTAKENWEQIFPRVEIEYVIDPHVLRPGAANEPPAVPNNEVKKQ